MQFSNQTQTLKLNTSVKTESHAGVGEITRAKGSDTVYSGEVSKARERQACLGASSHSSSTTWNLANATSIAAQTQRLANQTTAAGPAHRDAQGGGEVEGRQ